MALVAVREDPVDRAADRAGLVDLVDFRVDRVDPVAREDAVAEEAVAAVLPAVDNSTLRRSLK